jgi:hypothetical protein
MKNLTPEGLVMKTMTGMMTEGKETLVVQYHVDDTQPGNPNK